MKLSYTQKLYYKAIAKLLVVPLILIIPSAWMVWHFGSMILASATLFYASALLLTGFFTYPMFKKINALIDSKVDPIYSKYIEAPLMEDRDAAKRGIEGEQVVSGWLDEILPKSNWLVIKNQEFKGANGSKFDIDAVVVGPKGVFVFEIKNSSYNYFFTTEDCAVVVGDQIRPYDGTDPRLQVGRNADTIEKILKENQLPEIRTKRAVVFSRPDSFRFLGSPSVYLIDNKETLHKFIMEFPDDAAFNPERCKKIADTLK